MLAWTHAKHLAQKLELCKNYLKTKESLLSPDLNLYQGAKWGNLKPEKAKRSVTPQEVLVNTQIMLGQHESSGFTQTCVESMSAQGRHTKYKDILKFMYVFQRRIFFAKLLSKCKMEVFWQVVSDFLTLPYITWLNQYKTKWLAAVTISSSFKDSFPKSKHFLNLENTPHSNSLLIKK